MCDIWSVDYASRTYYILSFHMPPIAHYSFNLVEMHQAQADSSTVLSFIVNIMILVYELMCSMSGLYFMPARDYLHVVSYTSYYALLFHCSPVKILLGVTDQCIICLVVCKVHDYGI